MMFLLEPRDDVVRIVAPDRHGVCGVNVGHPLSLRHRTGPSCGAGKGRIVNNVCHERGREPEIAPPSTCVIDNQG